MSNRAVIHRWQAAVGCYSMHMDKTASLLQQLLPCEEEGFDDFNFFYFKVIYESLHVYSCITIKIAAIFLI